MSRDRWNDNPHEDPSEEHSLDDREGPQRCDLDGDRDSDEYDAVSCPHCGCEISELAEQCPHCGDWIVPGAGAASPRKPVLIAIAILLLVLLLLWVF